MFTPQINYLNISDYISFYENGTTIFKENSSKFENQEIYMFENVPLSGWILTFESFVPFNGIYTVKSYFLTHPTNPNIKFACPNIFNKLLLLDIEKGIIKNQIIIVNDGMEASFVVEGTKDFDIALSYLNNLHSDEKFSAKDLSVGDVVTFTSKHKTSEGFIFLGKAFTTSLNYSFANKHTFHKENVFSVIPSSKPSYIFYYKDLENKTSRIISVTSLKNLKRMDFKEEFSKINICDILNQDTDTFDILGEIFSRMTSYCYIEFISDSIIELNNENLEKLHSFFIKNFYLRKPSNILSKEYSFDKYIIKTEPASNNNKYISFCYLKN